MQFSRLICCVAFLTATCALLMGTPAVHASQDPPNTLLPALLAKSWLIGYALVFLAILLGLLAVLVPSMRKTLRKK